MQRRVSISIILERLFENIMVPAKVPFFDNKLKLNYPLYSVKTTGSSRLLSFYYYGLCGLLVSV